MKINLDTICFLWTFITAIFKLCGVIQISWLLVFLPTLFILSIALLITILFVSITICCSIGYASQKKVSLKDGLKEFKLKLKELEKELENNYDFGV